MSKVSYYIARKYLSNKKKKNVIHWITRISVIGIAIITLSMIIVMSAFNGIENVIEKLYTSFDTAIEIRSNEGKTFADDLNLRNKIAQTTGVEKVSGKIEELVVLRKGKVWVNATMVGVDDEFLNQAQVAEHIYEGSPLLQVDQQDRAILGVGLMEKLDSYVDENFGLESLLIYAPKRNMRVQLGSNPFYSSRILIGASMNYNKEINTQQMIVPLSFASELLRFDNELTSYAVTLKPDADLLELKSKLQSVLGSKFIVQTNFEKNALIFKTSKTEKIIVFVIMLCIFMLAAFNLIASLTMLFNEKLNDIKTLKSLGLSKENIFKIFFFEGILMAAKGIVFGFVIGITICVLQEQFGFIRFIKINGQPFPIEFNLWDGSLILISLVILSVLFSYLPVKYLVKKNLV